ncbi:MAG: hypothetical protein ACK4NW_01910 [Roseinatronobacter sp.]
MPDAPRTIYIDARDLSQLRFDGLVLIDPQPDHARYHHDDVARELLALIQEARNTMARGNCYRGLKQRIDAAIAQMEGGEG